MRKKENLSNKLNCSMGCYQLKIRGLGRDCVTCAMRELLFHLVGTAGEARGASGSTGIIVMPQIGHLPE